MALRGGAPRLWQISGTRAVAGAAERHLRALRWRAATRCARGAGSAQLLLYLLDLLLYLHLLLLRRMLRSLHGLLYRLVLLSLLLHVRALLQDLGRADRKKGFLAHFRLKAPESE